MFSLGLGNTRGKTIAVADVGGASVGVAIIVTSSKEPARVVASERVQLSMEERSLSASAAAIVALVGSTAEKAFAAYVGRNEKRGTPHITEAHAVIRAPWAHSKSIRAETIFPEDKKIDGGQIAALAKEALRSDTEFDHANMLEASVVRVELNGYPTSKPEEKRARRIAVTALLSDCDPMIRSGVAEALQRTFACSPPMLASGTRALLSVLRESDLLRKNCLVINMTSHATNLIAVRKGIATEIEHVLEGSWTIGRRIAGDKIPEEVFTLIHLLALDQCEDQACAAIKSALARVEPDLAKIFGEAFVKMAASRRLPNAAVLLVPHDLSEWLTQFFSRIDFAQFTVTTRPFEPRISSKDELAHMLTFDADIKSDPSLAVASAFAAAGAK